MKFIKQKIVYLVTPNGHLMHYINGKVFYIKPDIEGFFSATSFKTKTAADVFQLERKLPLDLKSVAFYITSEKL